MLHIKKLKILNRTIFFNKKQYKTIVYFKLINTFNYIKIKVKLLVRNLLFL